MLERDGEIVARGNANFRLLHSLTCKQLISKPRPDAGRVSAIIGLIDIVFGEINR
ncbi:MAG TPA: hypothetical protein VHN11_07580 [Xanthobacteraceae bacterium]|nr:hypothetical protein [Xanthobacteraceae bacterium]